MLKTIDEKLALQTLSVFSATLGAALFFAGINNMGPVYDEIEEAPFAEEAEVITGDAEKPALFSEVPNLNAESCQLSVAVSADYKVEDAILSLALLGEQSAELEWNAQTQNGVHRFTDLPKGHYALSVFADGRALKSSRNLYCAGDREHMHAEVDVSERGYLVALNIASSGALENNHRAPENTQVFVGQRDLEKNALSGSAQLFRNSDGRFLARLVPGTYQILIRGDHHESVERELRVTRRDAELNVNLRWRPEARGIVIDEEGAPVANARVFLGPNFDPQRRQTQVRTAKDGRFVLPVELSSNMTLAARSENALGFLSLAKPSASGFEGLTLRVKRGRVVTGHVYEQNGKARGFVKVRYRVKALGLEGVILADSKGHFKIPAMPKNHDVDLWADESAIGAWGGRVSAVGSRKPVSLTYVAPAYHASR